MIMNSTRRLGALAFAILAVVVGARPVEAGSPTFAQWGVDRTATPWVACLFDLTNCNPVGLLDPTNHVFTSVNGSVSVLAFDPVANQGQDDASIAINAAIAKAATASASANGATVVLPYGKYKIDNPIVMQSGVTLKGECAPNAGLGQTIFCSQILPGANMTDMVTQRSFAHTLFSVGMVDLSIENAGSFTVTNLVHLSLENSNIDHNVLTGSAKVSGDCMLLDRNSNSDPTWIISITRNQFFRCVNGYGLDAVISDSPIIGNYFSGSKNDVYLEQNGNRFVGNEIDNTSLTSSGGYGLIMINNVVACEFVDEITGNYFNQNQAGDILLKTQPSGCTTANDAPIIAGNSFQNSYGPGITISNGIAGGSITGNEFSPLNSAAAGGTVHISWGGTGNGGWQVLGNSFNLPPASRYANLPSDAVVIDGGYGGSNSMVNTWTVRGGYFYQSYNAAGVYPTQNVGAAVGYNFNTGSAETDFWNTNLGPTHSFIWHQQTGASSRTDLAALDTGGFSLLTGVFGSPQATWADNQTCTAGQVAWDASYIYVCTATNTVKRVALSSF